jgi:hypothetical protein
MLDAAKTYLKLTRLGLGLLTKIKCKIDLIVFDQLNQAYKDANTSIKPVKVTVRITIELKIAFSD